MEKKRVSVQIEGRSYSLITTDDEKYVQKVANEVLSHIRKAAQSTKQLDTRDCAVLAALNFCDDASARASAKTGSAMAELRSCVR